MIIEQNKIHITVNEIKSFFGVSFENVSVFFNEWTEKEDTLHMLEYLINYFKNNLIITKDSIESEILYNTQFQQLKRLITKVLLKLRLKQFI